ncbi:hypothetical protein C3B51_22930 [Pseudoalteromonas rubra]|uniref:DUF4198 domain-containing protein n=1 Tax=Pseudoalteromonas rubra TaxID=43658 RepID=A0A4Q7DX33_9GAMM|nr:DUF4198 domain-containing protein [Pseudoalteromonas rubra]RZM71058.1 hypothetical protein C3B51_22930 [Pseudoalteromonas rubra]
MNIIKNLKVKRVITRLLVTLNMLVLPTVLAHETFLLPIQSVWEMNSNVEVRMASGLSFPDLTWGVNQERISSSTVQLNGKNVASPLFKDGKAFLTVSFKASEAGFGVVAISTKKRSGDIEHKNTEGYLEEIGASESIKQAFRALPGKPPLHRSYVKHTKSLICVKSCKKSQDLSLKPVGQKLEFITANEDLNRFQLLLDGKPLPHHDVKVRNSEKELYQYRTDSRGMFSIGEQVSGAVMLAAVAITLPEKPDGLYHSDYASLVLNTKQ